MRNGIRKVLLAAVSAMLVVSFSTVRISPQQVSAETVSGGSTEDTNSGSGSTNYSGIYSSSEYVKPGNSWLTPVATHGETVIIALPIVNMTPYNIKDVIITPVISGKTADYPFEITQSNYTLTLDYLVGSNQDPDVKNRTKTLFWTFQTRDDVLNGYYDLKFNILYTDEVCNQGTSTISTFVKCIGKEGAANRNTDEKLAASTPRIIVTGFETNPEEVKAGQDFDLIIHLKNTSAETSVSNVEINLTATVEGKDTDSSYSSFLPTSGSNTAYFSSIPKSGVVDIEMQFTAKADLAQKPYVMKLAMLYEDEKNNPYTAEGSVSIPVQQESRFDVSTFEVMPSSIEVGGESNIMFSIYNTGKTKLYNVKASFKGDSITGGDTFVGNLDSGATGNVDTMVTGEAATMDEGTITVTVSYENEAGEVRSEEYETMLYVSEPFVEEMPDDMIDMNEGEMEPAGIPLWAKIVIAAAAVLVIAGAVLLVLRNRNKKKKHLELTIEDLDDED
ncbi:MAG: CARDB domain-containing protein [Lachnospiraceae bacterium]